MPQPDRLLNTLHQAARAFRDTPGRSGHRVRLPAGAEVLVAGDMHGSVENFRLLLRGPTWLPTRSDISCCKR